MLQSKEWLRFGGTSSLYLRVQDHTDVGVEPPGEWSFVILRRRNYTAPCLSVTIDGVWIGDWIYRTLRARAHPRNLQPQFPRTVIRLTWVEHVEMNGAAQIERTAMQSQRNSRKTEKPNSLAIEQALRCRVVSYSQLVYRASVIHLILLMARRINEAANFVLCS
jgi:hypothetical protein